MGVFPPIPECTYVILKYYARSVSNISFGNIFICSILRSLPIIIPALPQKVDIAEIFFENYPDLISLKKFSIPNLRLHNVFFHRIFAKFLKILAQLGIRRGTSLLWQASPCGTQSPNPKSVGASQEVHRGARKGEGEAPLPRNRKNCCRKMVLFFRGG